MGITPLFLTLAASLAGLLWLLRAARDVAPAATPPPPLRPLPVEPRDGRNLSRFDDRLEELSWAARYTLLLRETPWRDLREDAYRWSFLAERLASYATRHGLRTALCCSVGLNVDPWLLAAAGLRVVALDEAWPAVEATAHPGRLPRLYSDAKERWDIRQTHTYSGHVNPEAFDRMPDLARPEVVAELSARTLWLHADQGRLPLPTASIDLIFTCNALPRGDEPAPRTVLLDEWLRVLRPGGLVFLAMHNARGICREVRGLLTDRGLAEVSVRAPDGPAPGPRGAFAIFASSG